MCTLTRRFAHRLAAPLLALVIGATGALSHPQPAAATTGPYTLPFFNPAVVLTQGYGCTGYGSEPAYGSCAHWHGGLDFNLSYSSVASARAGTVARMLEAVPAESHNDPRGGNYLLIDHGGSRYTLYYHLQYNAVYPSLGARVSAGQHVAGSGNTGISDGPHLHYALVKSVEWWHGENAINPNGQWTTDPGRVPWLAAYDGESNGGTEYIRRGSTITHWVRFRNVGGRTWTQQSDANGKGRIFLAATDSNGTAVRNSAFQAADWSSAWFATVMDQAAVGPNGAATFTFGLKANPTVGSYREHFNLRAETLWWFDYGRIGSYHIPIQVTASSTCGTCA